MKKIEIKIGIYNFSLKNFKEISGHDDTLPFEGSLYANEKHIADCYNDGWGASAAINPIKENKELFDRISKYIVGKQYEGIPIDIPFIADMLAYKTAIS